MFLPPMPRRVVALATVVGVCVLGQHVFGTSPSRAGANRPASHVLLAPDAPGAISVADRFGSEAAAGSSPLGIAVPPPEQPDTGTAATAATGFIRPVARTLTSTPLASRPPPAHTRSC